MRKYRIRGQSRLGGLLCVGGGKNAALPILAALVLSKGESVIHNCPDIADIRISIDILRHLGCRVDFSDNALTVENTGITTTEIPCDLACKMRSSILFMGATLGRCGEVTIASPGGCKIGARPIDLHLKGLRKMGAVITDDGTTMHAKAEKLKGAWIYLPEISVGATENLMLAAACAVGTTTLVNAAREPEIVDLARFLTGIGATVHGAGTATIRITGTPVLGGTDHRVMPDRIVTGTYLLAAAMTGSDLTLTAVNPADIRPTLAGLLAMGCEIKEKPGYLRLRAPRVLKAIPHLITEAHPGFPTDMQAPFVAAQAASKGIGVVEERIFESRAAHVTELNRMGANILLTSDERVFVIKGRPRLHGATVESKDLRGGAALVLAALAAEGETIIHDKGYIERGYEKLTESLISVGASVVFE